MPDRLVTFEHDGHRFAAAEQRTPPASGVEETRYAWTVRMDDAPALEFHGGYPYRDEDVRKRILEWYEIQKPRAGADAIRPRGEAVADAPRPDARA